MGRSPCRAVLPAELAQAFEGVEITRAPGEFIEEALRDRSSDVLYRAMLGEEETLIYVLFEHQSTVDRLMAFRVLRYMVQIWSQWLGSPRNDYAGDRRPRPGRRRGRPGEVGGVGTLRKHDRRRVRALALELRGVGEPKADEVAVRIFPESCVGLTRPLWSSKSSSPTVSTYLGNSSVPSGKPSVVTRSVSCRKILPSGAR
ncbi:MAG: Rpn family recombination-promoting nuclease/putative transposase [Planctomycetes bacterium]|nr:Rpn family recombination-promoting nuclease/putative transposase [Planctomycetota bacterium]